MISPPGRLILFLWLVVCGIFKVSLWIWAKTKQDKTPASSPLGCLRSTYFSSPPKVFRWPKEVLFRGSVFISTGSKGGIFCNLHKSIHSNRRGMKTNFLNNSSDPHQTAWSLKLSVMKGILQRGNNKRLMRIWGFTLLPKTRNQK